MQLLPTFSAYIYYAILFKAMPRKNDMPYATCNEMLDKLSRKKYSTKTE